MNKIYLQTKLYAPNLLLNYMVHRPQLIETLQADFPRKLTLISAPAGFGKTTLISQWLHASPRYQVAWLSLDESDSLPPTFWGYIISALQTVWSNIGKPLLPLLEQSPLVSIPNLLIDLLNHIASQPDAAILILDDYHVLKNPTIHDQLTFFIDHLPPNLHLVISSRLDPPLSLARLRANRQLIELRGDDLRFSVAETKQLLNQTLNTSLSDAQIEQLAHRTEGWIASLQLAGLALQKQANPTRFIEEFLGRHHYLFDYLTSELVQTQSAAVQAFLLKTSILKRLTGPLCDAVLGEDLVLDSTSMLMQLHKHNLLLVPLDNQQTWYRYHHLFREVLQTTLARQFPNELKQLHQRASRWYTEHDQRAEAVDHAIAGEDFFEAAEILRDFAPRLLGQGELMTIKKWLDLFPTTVMNQCPSLHCYQAWLFKLLNQPQNMATALQQTEVALAHYPDKLEEDNLSTQAAVFALRADLARMEGNPQQAFIYLQQAKAILPQSSRVLRRAVWLNLGVAHLFKSDFEAARDLLAETLALANETGSLYIATGAAGYLSYACLMSGQLNQADHHSREIVKALESQTQAVLFNYGEVYLHWAKGLYEWNLLDEAEQQTQKGLRLSHGKFETDLGILDCLGVVQLRLAQNRLDEANSLLEEARAIVNEQPQFMALFHHAQVKLLLRHDAEAAIRWANHAGSQEGLRQVPWAILNELAIARVWLYQRRLDELLERLEAITPATAPSLYWRLEALLLQALAHHAQQQSALALAVLAEALTLAEPQSFIRLFVDEGPPLAELLQLCRAKAIHPSYVEQLLMAFSQADHLPATTPPPLIEPLNEREQLILTHLARGLNTPEIAEAVIVSKNTVKWYLKNIYGKLGVNRRSQALAAARRHGLIA